LDLDPIDFVYSIVLTSFANALEVRLIIGFIYKDILYERLLKYRNKALRFLNFVLDILSYIEL
jgi:hypothetical protein